MQKSKQRKKTNHTFHLIATLCTFGLWGFMVWPWVWMWNRFGPTRDVVRHY